MLVNGSMVSVPACSPARTDAHRAGVAPTVRLRSVWTPPSAVVEHERIRIQASSAGTPQSPRTPAHTRQFDRCAHEPQDRTTRGLARPALPDTHTCQRRSAMETAHISFPSGRCVAWFPCAHPRRCPNHRSTRKIGSWLHEKRNRSICWLVFMVAVPLSAVPGKGADRMRSRRARASPASRYRAHRTPAARPQWH